MYLQAVLFIFVLKSSRLHLLQEALEKAVLENPELIKEHPELQSVVEKARAGEAKEAGNRAFAAKSFEAAVQHFTSAIALHEDPVFYSNRAATYHALKQFRKAVADAKQVVALDAKWVKGWSRLAAAHFALEEWSEVFHSFTSSSIKPKEYAGSQTSAVKTSEIAGELTLVAS